MTKISPLKAIRFKCLDCCCGSSNEVKLCTLSRCPLYPFREGVNPNRKPRVYTPEQKAAMVSRLGKNKPADAGEKSANHVSEGKDTTPAKSLQNPTTSAPEGEKKSPLV